MLKRLFLQMYTASWRGRAVALQTAMVCAYSCLVATFFVLAVVGETCADTLSDQVRLAIGAIMAGAYFMSLVECLIGGLLSWVLFLAVLPPKFDRAMLFKSTPLVAESVALVTSLASYAVTFIVLDLCEWGPSWIKMWEIGAEYPRAVWTMWLTILIRLLHNMTKLGNVRLKKSVIAMAANTDLISVSRRDLDEALQCMQAELPEHIEADLQGKLDEFFLSDCCDSIGDASLIIMECDADQSRCFFNIQSKEKFEAAILSSLIAHQQDSDESSDPSPPPAASDSNWMTNNDDSDSSEVESSSTLGSSRDQQVCKAVAAAFSRVLHVSSTRSRADSICEIIRPASQSQPKVYGLGGIVISYARWLCRHKILSATMCFTVGLHSLSDVYMLIIIGRISGILATATMESTSLVEYILPGLWLAAAIIAIQFSDGFKNMLAEWLAALVQDDMTQRLFTAVCKPGIYALIDTPAGDLISCYARDTTVVVGGIQNVVVKLLLDPLMRLAVALTFLSSMSWQLVIMIVFCIPACYQMTARLPIKALEQSSKAAARLQGTFGNAVELRRITELYASGDFVLANAQSALSEAKSKAIKAGILKGVTETTVQVWGSSFQGVAFLAVLCVGYQRFLSGQDPARVAETVTAGILLVEKVKGPLRSLAQGFSQLLGIGGSLCRIDDTITRQTEDDPVGGADHKENNMDDTTHQQCDDVQDVEAPPPPPRQQPTMLSGDISLNMVTFKYNSCKGQQASAALDCVSMLLPAAKYTCLVGPSGSGKSTVIELLTRNLVACSGTVRLDDTPLPCPPASGVASWREQIGLVAQQSTLMAGTVASNIRLGNPGASYNEVVAAAKRAECHELICALPDGYETVLGDQGTGPVSVSGGQRQRICLAQALCRKPTLLLLDEATSALDSITEGAIIDTILRLVREEGLTVVSVTHKMATTRSADLVYVLQNGKVEQGGPPAVLLKQRGGLFGRLSSDGVAPDDTAAWAEHGPEN